ncbi:MAG TPA: carbohydrate ABC transporter substrate-binding protein [Candidatus Fraserbacteria bacterium]|nr:carbohydrate ABC transporter substrate-binding protein [Candidatus Fraserbacteria bacterium]
MLKRSLTLLLITGFALVAMFTLTSSNAATAATAMAAQGRTLDFVTSFAGQELTAFQKVVDAFTQKTGIKVNVEPVSRNMATVLGARVASGNPPDLANLPNPGLLDTFAQAGNLVSLDWFKQTAVFKEQPKAFIDLGTLNGTLYGIFPVASLKSLVWYDPKEFAKFGYTIPSTFGELLQLQDQMVKDGNTPWCIGLESGAASGWPGTDWMEDFMLRSAGPKVYDQWVAHDIPWTDPRVREVFQLFGLFANDGMAFGGRKGILSTNFGDSVAGLNTTPPECMMHRQATFILSFILKAHPKLVAGKDFNIFPFPSFNSGPAPLEGGGDVFVAFKDSPEMHQLIEYFASVEAQELWAKVNPGRLAVNKDVPASAYPDPVTAKAAKILSSAEVFRFDGSDLMPAAVGSGSFWSAVLDFVQGSKPLTTILCNLEASADSAYKSGAATGPVGNCK